MSIKTFFANFFIAAGIVFTFRLIASKLDDELLFDEWYVLLSALVMAVVTTFFMRRKTVRQS